MAGGDPLTECPFFCRSHGDSKLIVFKCSEAASEAVEAVESEADEAADAVESAAASEAEDAAESVSAERPVLHWGGAGLYLTTGEIIADMLQDKYDIQMVMVDSNSGCVEGAVNGDIDCFTYNHEPWLMEYNDKNGTNFKVINYLSGGMPFEAERHAVPSGRLCCFSGICSV